MSPDPGQTSAVRTIGRYRAFDELGRGAMGVVYRGFDPMIGRSVALKTLLLDSADEQAREFRERLYREAAAAGALSHPNIVTIFDIVQEGDLTAVAMEFIEGRSLAAIIREQGPLPLDVALEYFDQMCSALDFAGSHGIIHRDIKPPNILVTPAGRVKITDFGVARLAMSTMTQAGTVLGSPSYMSPEQVRGLPLDPRSDLFSAAVVFYEMITRERPFAGNDVATTMYRIAHEPPIPPSQFNKAVGPDLTAVLERALAKNPDHRFPTGAQLVSELRRVIVGRPAAPVPAAPTPAVATVVVSPPAPEVSASGGGLAPIPTGAGPAVSQPAPAAPVAAEPDVAPVIPPLAASPARTGRRSRRGLLLGLAAVVVLAGVLAGAVLYFQRPATPLPEAGRTPATTTAGAPVQPATPAVPPAEPPLPATPAVPAASLSTATTPAVTAPSIPVPSTTAPGQPTPPASGPRRRPPAAASPSTAPPPPVPVQAPPTPAQARPPGRQIYGATEVDERPQVVRQTAPIFPASAVRKNVEDVVVLRVLVAADGRAEEIQVLRGSMKDSSFDNAAVMAVQLWKFSPARKAGQPVASWFNVAVPFQMKR